VSFFAEAAAASGVAVTTPKQRKTAEPIARPSNKTETKNEFSGSSDEETPAPNNKRQKVKTLSLHPHHAAAHRAHTNQSNNGVAFSSNSHRRVSSPISSAAISNNNRASQLRPTVRAGRGTQEDHERALAWHGRQQQKKKSHHEPRRAEPPAPQPLQQHEEKDDEPVQHQQFQDSEVVPVPESGKKKLRGALIMGVVAFIISLINATTTVQHGIITATKQQPCFADQPARASIDKEHLLWWAPHCRGDPQWLLPCPANARCVGGFLEECHEPYLDVSLVHNECVLTISAQRSVHMAVDLLHNYSVQQLCGSNSNNKNPFFVQLHPQTKRPLFRTSSIAQVLHVDPRVLTHSFNGNTFVFLGNETLIGLHQSIRLEMSLGCSCRSLCSRLVQAVLLLLWSVLVLIASTVRDEYQVAPMATVGAVLLVANVLAMLVYYRTQRANHHPRLPQDERIKQQ